MEWLQFVGYIAAIFAALKWLLSEFKIYRTAADKERKELHSSIKNIEKEVTELHKVLHPIEKRHSR